jgi:hypothetical protein
MALLKRELHRQDLRSPTRIVARWSSILGQSPQPRGRLRGEPFRAVFGAAALEMES